VLVIDAPVRPVAVRVGISAGTGRPAGSDGLQVYASPVLPQAEDPVHQDGVAPATPGMAWRGFCSSASEDGAYPVAGLGDGCVAGLRRLLDRQGAVGGAEAHRVRE
jgi:hypothetical protein